MMQTVNESNRVVVIGAGLGGLAAACTLAARGYAVTLCDKNPWVGGKAAILSEQGYRFDMGRRSSRSRKSCGESSPRPGAILTKPST